MSGRATSRVHAFEAPLLFDPEIDDGYMKHFVPIPHAVAASLEAASVVRVEGRLGNVPFRRALHRRADGTPCLRFGAAWLRDAGLSEGAALRVRLAADPDPSRVDVPDELAAALDRDPEAALAWSALTPGRQRTLAYPIERAKQPSTRVRRAAAVVGGLLLGLDRPGKRPAPRRAT